MKISVKLIPNSSKTEVVQDMKDLFGDRQMRIKVNAPPEKNKANKLLIDFLSEYLSVKKDQIKIISGQYSRNKIIKIDT